MITKTGTLYEQIAEKIRREIETGKWAVGEKVPSSKYLTKRYDCSNNTIERALQELSNQGYVTRKLRSGTYVNSPHEWGTKKVSCLPNVIGAVVFDIQHGVWSAIVRGIDDEVSRNGYCVLLVNTDRNYDKAESSIEELLKEGINGLIYSPVVCKDYEKRNARIIQRMEESGVPYVLIDGYVDSIESNYVVSDNVNAAYSLTNKLIQCGHKRILIITDAEGYAAKTRVHGCRKAMEDAGIVFDESLILRLPCIRDYSISELTERFEDVFRQKEFTALFALHDRYAAAAYYALRAIGKEVPKDVSIVTFDKTEESYDVPLSLTCVCQPTYEMGKKAAQVLCEQLEPGVGNISKIVMKSRLEDGNSVAKV